MWKYGPCSKIFILPIFVLFLSPQMGRSKIVTYFVKYPKFQYTYYKFQLNYKLSQVEHTITSLHHPH